MNELGDTVAMLVSSTVTVTVTSPPGRVANVCVKLVELPSVIVTLSLERTKPCEGVARSGTAPTAGVFVEMV